MNRQKMILALVLAAVVGWSGHAYLYPANCPPSQRPIAKLVAKLAKWGLWVFLFADKPHAEPPRTDTETCDHSGFPLVDHRRAL